MKRQVLPALVTFTVMQCFTVISGFEFVIDYNMSEYWQMPALYEYESIESCLRPNPEGVFCIVKSVVKPDEQSTVWKTIKKYSRLPSQYEHSVLTRGVCLQQCEELVKSLSDEQRALFFQPKFDINYRYIINDWILPNIEHYRHKYGALVNICLNYRIQTKYNLTVYSEIEHCATNTTVHRSTDFWDILFYSIIAMLTVLGIASTVYDARIAKDRDHNHYRTPVTGRLSIVLTAFSLRRNMNRLTMKHDTDQLQRDLRFLDGIRVLIITCITVSHVGIGLAMTTTQNPDLMENVLSRVGVQLVLSQLPFQVDVFFTISGLLLAAHFIKFTEGKPFSGKPFWMGVANRYLRSVPLYGLVLLFTVSVYDQLQLSPSAYKIMPMMRTICRSKWWINLLFINNYYRPEEQCLIHTWYLAADFQLFVFGLATLMVLWKFPNLLRPIVYLFIAGGLALTMFNFYNNSLDGMMLLVNKGNAYQLWYDPFVTRSYQATETHCLCFFGGMLVGIIYHKMQNNDLLLAKSRLYKILQYIVVPWAILFLLPSPVFHQYNFSKPSVWMSVFAGIHRLCAACFLSVGMLLLLFAERGTFFGNLRASKLLENAFYRVLGRLGFGFYLIHMTVLGLVYGNHHESARGSVGLIISVFCSVTLLTYILALMAYLLVEKPCDIIFKQLLGGGTRQKEERGVSSAAANHSDLTAVETRSRSDEPRRQKGGKTTR